MSDFKLGEKVRFGGEHRLAGKIGEVVYVNQEYEFFEVRFESLSFRILSRLGSWAPRLARVRPQKLAFSFRWARTNLQRAETSVQRETEDAEV